ncbi:hypothetical protein EOD39_21597 [Acipenser ruthenus]|uniref:Uncharacterized protein n=1 Tax=Acipenser ruthenus TaxID=7906 RepID=A0A444UM36_ACIRT|nr:hypothetical protein EOD39_21597 [Acipenser ruthenus]
MGTSFGELSPMGGKGTMTNDLREGVLRIPGELVIALASLETPPPAPKDPQKHRPLSVHPAVAKQGQLDPTLVSPNRRKRKPHTGWA